MPREQKSTISVRIRLSSRALKALRARAQRDGGSLARAIEEAVEQSVSRDYLKEGIAKLLAVAVFPVDRMDRFVSFMEKMIVRERSSVKEFLDEVQRLFNAKFRPRS